jgi:hypothetical protein
VVRCGSPSEADVELWLGGKPLAAARARADDWQELELAIPPGVPSQRAALELRSSAPLSVLHYWSYAAK